MKWNKVGSSTPTEWKEYLTTNGLWVGVLVYKHGCWFNDLQKVEGITHWMVLPPSPTDEKQSDPAEVQQLRQWKKEAMALLDPILEYGLKHPDMKLGQCATTFVLNRAKSAEVLVKALEEIAGYVAHNGDDWAKRTAEAALLKHKNQANEVNNDTKNEG